MKDVALVTGCDRRYLDLLLELLDNLRDLEIAALADLIVFDIDFTDADRSRLAPYGVEVKRLDTEPIDIAVKDTHRRHLVSTIRPTLPSVFPGYRTYVYLDVDIWFQDARAFADIVAATDGGALVFAEERHAAYRSIPRYHFYRKVYGPSAPAELVDMPIMWNGGLVAGRADAPGWNAWASEYRRAADICGVWFGAGQAALGRLVLDNAITIRALPATDNWLVGMAIPMWDGDARQLKSPVPPFEPIRVIHKHGDKTRVLSVPTQDGSRILTSLRYPAFRDLLAGRSVPDQTWRRAHHLLSGRQVTPPGVWQTGYRKTRAALGRARRLVMSMNQR